MDNYELPHIISRTRLMEMAMALFMEAGIETNMKGLRKIPPNRLRRLMHVFKVQGYLNLTQMKYSGYNINCASEEEQENSVKECVICLDNTTENPKLQPRKGCGQCTMRLCNECWTELNNSNLDTCPYCRCDDSHLLLWLHQP